VIVGGYTLDLYCDVMLEDWQHSYDYGKDQITGETGGECRRRARRIGWRLDLKSGTATCPTCVKAGR
jgi:hypothetical protein